MIGSAVGGLLGGKAAGQKRTAPLRDARSAAGKATLAYDTKVTNSLAAGNLAWTTEFVPAAERRMKDAGDVLSARMDWTLSHANRELDIIENDLHRLARSPIQVQLSDAARTRAPIAMIAHRRRRRWENAAHAALKPEARTDACLDVLCAVEGGKAIARALLLEVSRRRACVLSVVDEEAHRAGLASMSVRSDVMENLRTQRTNMQQEFKAKTHPAAVKVWLSTQLVRKELVNTGTKTPEWVKENLPSVECPKS